MAQNILRNLLEKYESLSNIKCNSKSLLAIKSNIMYHYLQRAMSCHMSDMPKSLYSESEYCQWCLNKWTQGQLSMELKPEKHPKSTLRRLFRKPKEQLNRYQLKLVLKYKNRWKSNALKLLCSTCGKETTIYMRKPRKRRKKKPYESSPIKQKDTKKGKKNKKKDVYAGLKQSVFTGPLSKNNAPKHNYKGTNRPYRSNDIRLKASMYQVPKGSHNHVSKKNSMVQDFLTLY